MTGTIQGTQCLSSNGNNDGCGVTEKDGRSYGDGFNQVCSVVIASITQGSLTWIIFPRQTGECMYINGITTGSECGSSHALKFRKISPRVRPTRAPGERLRPSSLLPPAIWRRISNRTFSRSIRRFVVIGLVQRTPVLGVPGLALKRWPIPPIMAVSFSSSSSFVYCSV